jgi:predicted metal-dependent peptidase
MSTFDAEVVRQCNARLAAARFLLFRDAPFFGPLVARLKPTPSHTEAGTMGVMADARLLYEPEFVRSLPLRQLAGCLAHEVLHLVGDVFGRRGERDPYLWNVSHDAVINPMVLSYKDRSGKAVLELPEGVVLIPEYAKLSAEQVYERLKREQENRGRKRKFGKGRGASNPLGTREHGCANHSHPDNCKTSNGRTPGGMSRQEWQQAVAEAAEGARMQGHLPADIERWVDSLLRPQLDWKQYLVRKTAGFLGGSRYTYHRPSRRSYAAGTTMPGRVQYGRDATIALDTSGSINQNELLRFASEAEGIIKSCGGRLHVFACDAQVAAEATVGSIRDFTPKGGGGTSFVPVFERIRERRLKVRMLIYFTDLQGTFPKESPPFPVLWCVPEDQVANAPRPPFGKVLPVPAGIRS